MGVVVVGMVFFEMKKGLCSVCLRVLMFCI